MGSLDGQVAIITGGTSGIGRAGVEKFLAEGARVVVGARNADAGAELMREIGSDALAFQPTDVTDPTAVADLVAFCVDQFGPPSIAYSNAGSYRKGRALDTSVDDWAGIVAVNLSAHFYFARAVLPHLVAAGRGSLILTASELGLVGTEASVAYCAAKGGVVNLTRALAVDCKGTGVRVNCIAPGPIDTPMLEMGFQQSDDPDATREAQRQPLLLERFGTPAEIANVAAFLASDASSYMTGAVVVADGGATAWYGF